MNAGWWQVAALKVCSMVMQGHFTGKVQAV